MTCETKKDFLKIVQSFVVALLTIVIATFSTGIDSQCFQVCIFRSPSLMIVEIRKPLCEWNIVGSAGSQMRKKMMTYHMVMGSSISFLPLELCTLLCC